MTLALESWEQRLLHWAIQGIKPEHRGDNTPVTDTRLESAYKHCDAVTRYHSKTFFLASSLLPIEKRKAVRALYAFCRITDDIVDNPVAKTYAEEALLRWSEDNSGHPIVMNHPVVVAWADARARFHIPSLYAQQLVEGVARDLRQTHYQTFAELAEYSYGVASTVGLMAMHIIGFSHEDALPYAIKLGVALQTTNILRDIGEDWRRDRLYLPLDELYEFGVTQDDIAHGRINDNWREFMRFQIARCHQLYAESLLGITYLHDDGRFAITAAAELYRGILDDIEANDYDVFNRRAHLSTSAKLRRLPTIWWKSKHASA